MSGTDNPPPTLPSSDSGDGRTDDDRADDMLIHAARDYNLPGTVPREEIWAKISEARRATAQTPVVPTSIAGESLAKKRSVWLGPGIGIAAALLISTGIVIGRQMTAPQGSAPITNARPSETASTSSGAEKLATTGTNTRDTLQEQLHQETRRTNEAARALAAANVRDTSTTLDNRRDGQRGTTTNLAYQLVVMRHLAGTEAMITSFRHSTRGGVPDSTMAEW
jgi:hypothetical protein